MLTYYGIDSNRKLLDSSNTNSKEPFFLVLGVSLALGFGFVSFLILFTNTLGSIISSLLLSILGTAFLLNMFRLVFSISIGELDKRSTTSDIALFVLKRSPILVIIAILCSMTVQSVLLEPVFSEDLSMYRTGVLNDYKLSLESSSYQEKERLNEEFENTRNYYLDIGREREIEDLKTMLDEELIKISKVQQKKMDVYAERISTTPFLMARMKILLNQYFFLSFFIIGISIGLFLYPVYFYVRSDTFSSYDRKNISLQHSIITNEFVWFKQKYSQSFVNTIGQEVSFTSRYEDPPFNKVLRKKAYRKLAKGSLAQWYKNFVKNE